ncbi:AGE family epimerase/isomerase [uncultured Sunxiuqinia sp.]|uniref:AGE family epimerase/isomerase n=1 Tax=uncultured Sunxiuqinia sp. TaxID=1573825 RepID=UPI00261A4034|nr:AGE family epimerase/isomerase [uncultured Sunxiuqinia sp.]
MMIDRSELISYLEIFEKELHDDILAYWMAYGVEKKGHGFYGAVDLDNKPVLSANKTSVLNSRILWTFSAAAKQYPEKAYESLAHRAYRVIREDFADNEFGGFFMELSSSNQVESDVKHTYAQAFVIYSLCKYYEFAPSEELLSEIQTFFLLLDAKTKDPVNPGYLESFTRGWEPITENRMADNNEPKSLNTHLHLLEAYAAVYKVWKSELVKRRLTELLELFIHRIIRPDGHLGVFFTTEFEETESSKEICSFGQEIEGSWMIWEAAEILGDKEILACIKPLILKMADAVLRVGVDKDGGVFLESTRWGSHIRTNKHWWLQAEALVGFMNSYQLTGDSSYWETVKLTWSFIDQFVIDHDRGEWFTKVSRLGEAYVVEPENDPSPFYRNDWKIDPWKCPYHNGRAMLELVNRISELLENSADANSLLKTKNKQNG